MEKWSSRLTTRFMKQDAICYQAEFLRGINNKISKAGKIDKRGLIIIIYTNKINRTLSLPINPRDRVNQREEKYLQSHWLTSKEYLALFVDICKHFQNSIVIQINVLLCRKNASIVISCSRKISWMSIIKFVIKKFPYQIMDTFIVKTTIRILKTINIQMKRKMMRL